MQLSTLLAHHARYRPEATAVVFEDRRFSYREFNARVDRVAHALLALGIRQGRARRQPAAQLRSNCSTSTGPAPASAP
jgi:non-ribosomal peptide synthetase component E (peptide arylation enzyme)